MLSPEARIGLVQVVLGLLALMYVHVQYWERSNLVYELHHTTPLLLSLHPKLGTWERIPGKSLSIKIENIGRRPSENVSGVIMIPGGILHVERTLRERIYCEAAIQKKTSELRIKIDRCTPDHPIEFSIVYKDDENNEEEPKISIIDGNGDVPRVTSIVQQKQRTQWIIYGVFTAFAVFNGFLIQSSLSRKRTRSEVQGAVYISTGRSYMERDDLRNAAIYLKQGLAVAPDLPEAYILMGRLRKRQALLIDPGLNDETARRLMTDARDACTTAIKSSPDNESAYYNRACYRSRLGEPIANVFDDLQKAIELNPENRDFALEDGDFTTNLNYDELKNLIDSQ